MAVHKGKAHQGKSTHNSKPSSAMSKHAHVTKPESRHGDSHKYSVAAAESKIRKVHGC